MKDKNNTSNLIFITIVISLITLVIISILNSANTNNALYNVDNIPVYNGKSHVYLKNNIPDFSDDDYQKSSFEYYSNLDNLGRVGVAYSNIGQDIMPTEKRKSISNIYPTGWNQAKYDMIKGKYLYNRCHLIGYQLTGENANKNNLMTCTRSMNIEGMLSYENEVANYVKKTNKHVLYRVTPIFEGTNLLATGVQIEASSVEDRCKTICFNVYIYNVQNGIKINYQNGESQLIAN